MDFWRWISAKDDQEQEVLIACCNAVSILFGVSRNTDWESAKQVFDSYRLMNYYSVVMIYKYIWKLS